jgi:hypothetical protein
VRSGLIVCLKERSNEALIPLGGSNTRTVAALSKVEGTLGLFSMVKNSLKSGFKVIW